MDAKQIEAVLIEVGKVFRLCRFYPATHPSVQQAMADLSGALPSLAPLGDVELRIGPTGLALDTTMVAAKNPQIQELAGLLYAQGYRAILLQPGATADEFATLVRATAGTAARTGSALGVVPRMPQLPHIQLERAASRKSTAATPARSSSPGMRTVGEGPSLSARSAGVFRPNALPPDIEVNRLTALLEFATAEGARGPLTRLGEVAARLAGERNFPVLAAAVRALARWQGSVDATAAEAARRSLAACVNDGTLAGIVSVVADAGAAAEQRQAAVEALGALGERAVAQTFDAYVGAADDAARFAYQQAIEVAGAAALGFLASRVAGEEAETARAAQGRSSPWSRRRTMPMRGSGARPSDRSRASAERRARVRWSRRCATATRWSAWRVRPASRSWATVPWVPSFSGGSRTSPTTAWSPH
jgi:hypothetical protein